MSRFKEGDEVIIIPSRTVNAGYPDARPGDRGTIVSVDEDGWCRIKFENKPIFFATPDEIGFDIDSEWMEKVEIAKIEEIHDG